MDSVAFVGPMDRVLLLRTMPLFEGLGPVQLAAIAQHARERFVARGTRLEIGQKAGGAVLLIVDGELGVRTGKVERRCVRGDAAGFVEMLGASDSAIELEALADTMTLELEWDAQIDVCEEHFAVVMRYIAFLAGEILAHSRGPSLSSASGAASASASVSASVSASASEQGPVPLIAAQAFGDTLDLNERLLLLSRSRVFSPRCLDALSELAHHAEEQHFDAGQTIWTAGADADHFLLLASGVLEERDADGNLRRYGAGTAPGIDEALAGARRQRDLIGVEPALALRIPLEPFIDILEDHFDLSLDVLSTQAGRLLAHWRA